MFSTPTARFMAAIIILTLGFAAIQSTVGGNSGVLFAGAFAFLYLVRNSDLWQYIARPFSWATELLTGETQ